MTSSINLLTGTFTTDSTPSPVTLNIPSGTTEIEIINTTDYLAKAAAVVKAKGYSGVTGCADLYTGNGASPNVIANTEISSDGFTFFYDSASLALGSAVAITGINQINHPLALSATTGAIGDVVRVYGTTGMLQIASMDFTVTAVNAGVSQTLGYLDASGFAAPATAGYYRKIPYAGSPLAGTTIAPNPRYYPRVRYVTGITQAANCVVTCSVTHTFQVGEKVRMRCPAAFGMKEIDGLLGTVLSVAHSATVNSVTLDIDTSAMTAFAFPTTGVASVGVSFPLICPVGEAAINTIALPVANSLDDRTRNTSMNGVIIGASCLVASKNYQWIAKKALSV